MSGRRRGQLVLLAAAVVVTALVPMLLAYAQLTVGVAGEAADTDATQSLDDATRSLERAVADTTVAVANGTDPDSHRTVAALATDRLNSTVTTLESSGTGRGVTVAIDWNASAARNWARTDCPGGPGRAFDTCAVDDGVVTQTRANSTALVAVAFDVTVRGPDGTATATVVIRGVRGVIADRRSAAASLTPPVASREATRHTARRSRGRTPGSWSERAGRRWPR
ncbi:DUF7261 family protein [Haloplanus rubicundus]|uniref:Uncharacterized protein n=1 Tax=Haloplanus rubicundus TaxID=1547898 RepID=A0A345EB08_9EURY|nr:hypothetical protein [Haloplanus rubicundus]AXG09380.1 hypothetical protein DU484_05560 [Haloplanus rubicundus]